MHATFLDGSHINIPRINEAHDNNAEQVVITQNRRMNLRQTTQQFFEIILHSFNRNTGTEKRKKSVNEGLHRLHIQSCCGCYLTITPDQYIASLETPVRSVLARSPLQEHPDCRARELNCEAEICLFVIIFSDAHQLV